MPVSLGALTITAMYLGTTAISGGYLGTTQVFSSSTFSPSSLFASSEPGVWYDPSDLTTLFTDTAGTTPVTAPAQTVALMLDKSKGLVLGAELVTNGTFASSADWTLGAGWSIGSGLLTSVTGSSASTYEPVNFTNGAWYRITFTVTRHVSGGISVSLVGASSGSASTSFVAAAGTYTLLLQAPVSTTGEKRVQINRGFTNVDLDFDNISVRELAGNHATQATAASRPTYGVVPLGGRRNLLTWSEDFGNAAWVKTNLTQTAGVTDPDGGNTATTITATSANAFLYQVASAGASGRAVVPSLWVRRRTGSGAISLRNGYSDIAITVSSTWTRVSPAYTSAGANDWVLAIFTSGDAIDIWHPQLELGSTATAYQRVSTAFDVTEAGVQSCSYLSFDGVDDFMLTGTITPGIDRAQVFAGVRKLSDAARGTIVELSATIASNNGSFHLTAPNAASATFGFESKGTTLTDAVATFAAPTTRVVVGLGDISGDTSTLRVNGTQQDQDTGDQGTGNYLAYPLYVGRRGGTTLPFSGQIYSLITRFGANLTTPQITDTETWVAGKTGVTL